jgi:hypothetical protein
MKRNPPFLCSTHGSTSFIRVCVTSSNEHVFIPYLNLLTNPFPAIASLCLKGNSQ